MSRTPAGSVSRHASARMAMAYVVTALVAVLLSAGVTYLLNKLGI